MARLKDYYEKEVVSALIKAFDYKNRMEVRDSKKLLSTWTRRSDSNIKILDSAVQELSLITGQKPVITKARRSIATFKLRQGMSIGCSVTSGKNECMSFLIDWLMLISLGFVISEEFRRNPLTEEEFLPWD